MSNGYHFEQYQWAAHHMLAMHWVGSVDESVSGACEERAETETYACALRENIISVSIFLDEPVRRGCSAHTINMYTGSVVQAIAH